MTACQLKNTRLDMKTRNPIANAAKKIRPQTVPDKRKQVARRWTREEIDEIERQAKELHKLLNPEHYIYTKEGD